MKSVTRRNFLRFSAAAAAVAHLRPSGLQGAVAPEDKADIGIYVVLDQQNVDGTFIRISDLGFRSCELYTDGYGMEMAASLQDAIKKYSMRILALFTLGPGPTTWDFYEGQRNIGLVCREYRDARVDALYKLSDLAKACNIPMIETHVGYIPENPLDPNYGETVEALKKVVGYCSKNKQDFLYHAGQETPTTLLRTMTDVGYDNQGVGMDTANLIMYDRGHPYYALDVYGKHVKLVNCKDGLYPVDSRNLGREVQIGQGMVIFPTFLKKLQESGYKGPVIIEREASDGAQWEKDVRQSRDYLRSLFVINKPIP